MGVDDAITPAKPVSNAPAPSWAISRQLQERQDREHRAAAYVRLLERDQLAQRINRRLADFRDPPDE